MSADWLKQLILEADAPPPPQEFAFVDVAWARALTEKTDAAGFPLGTIDIVDRQQLADFLRGLRAADVNYRYILLDVVFTHPSAHDSALAAELAQTPRLLASNHLVQDSLGQDTLEPSLFKLDFGVSDFNESEDKFIKQRLFHGRFASTPLKLFLALHGGAVTHGKVFDKIGERWVQDVFVPVQRIRNLAFDTAYAHHYLTDATIYDDEFLRDAFNDRLIILGDFSDRDLHETIYGDLPGPIILLNSYIALREGDADVHWALLVFLWLGFTAISYKAISDRDYWDRYIYGPIQRRFGGGLVLNLLSYIAFFWVLMLVGHLVFGTVVFMLGFALYMELLESAVQRYRERKAQKSPAQPLRHET